MAVRSAIRPNEYDAYKNIAHIVKFLPQEETLWCLSSWSPTTTFTFLLFIATAGLWIFTGMLWSTTQSAVVDGEQATQAAVRAAIAAERTLHSDRAWLVFERVEITTQKDAFLDGIKVGDGIGVTVNWINTGRTPAVHVNACIELQFCEVDSDLPNFSVELPLDSRAIVGQNKTFGSIERFVSEKELESIREHRQTLFIYSKAEYFSIFDDKNSFFTEVSMKVTWQGCIRTAGGSITDRLSVQPCGPQNRCI
jgi:hypothetical protein